MKSTEIRKRFIEYFLKVGHEVVPSSSLIPKGDPTLLFTNAGMVQFKGVFLNEETREYKTAVSCQKCIRAGGKHNDLENVGRTARHHTFFEMLGNFSFGDYFKEGAIEFAWDFLTREMRLPKERLWVTIFESDDDAGEIWKKKAGVSADRIVRMGAKDNFWSMGDTGPCGPCSEILIDQGKDVGCGRPECAVGCDCDRFLEIWNLVFMQYNRSSSGELTPLPNPCIDTGMGLERLSTVMQGKKSNYDSDVFRPIIAFIEDATSVKYGAHEESDISMRAVADHARAVTFLIAEGVLPGNVDRGYVLRRILRRAARHARFLGVKEPFIYKVNEKVIELMGEAYPDIVVNRDVISKATKGEEERFLETLERGLGLLDDEVKRLKARKESVIPGPALFKLYDTFGFPVDLTADIVKREGLGIDEAGFSVCMEEQKKKARSAWKGAGAGAGAGDDIYKTLASDGLKTNFVGYHMQSADSKVLCIIKNGASVEAVSVGESAELIIEETPFYGESGGQAGDSGVISSKNFSVSVLATKKSAGLTVHICKVASGTVRVDDHVELVPDIEARVATARNHTATHILHSALRRALGEHVRQAGSLVNASGLRFDFNHFEALKPDEIRKIEDAANRAVVADIEVITEVLPYKKAVEKGALAFFGEKYGDVVRLVSVPTVSAELCGGTHVKRTGEIGLVKITSESSVASGTRRLEAVTGLASYELFLSYEGALKASAALLKSPEVQLPERIKKLIDERKELEKEIHELKTKGKAGAGAGLVDKVKKINGISVIAEKVEATNAGELREMADMLRAKLQSGVVVLGCKQDDKAVLLAAVTKDLTGRFSAGEIIKSIAPVVGGKGGGKPDLAQAGGNDPSKIFDALLSAVKMVEAGK